MISAMRVNHEFIGKILSSPGSANTKKNPMSPRAAATPRISTANGTAATTPRSVKKIYNATGPLLINNSKEKKELSFFNLLYTEMGFKNCQKYFTDESMNTKGTFTENQFIHFMRELTDLGDHQIVEIFDIFDDKKDNEDTGTLGFQSFFLLFSLITALESGQGKQFLYLHGEAMFELIARSCTATHITWQEFVRFGYLMGLNECDVYNYLSSFNINIFHQISKEDFEIYYFVVLDDIDEGRKVEKSWDVSNRNSQQGDDEKKQCSIQ